MNSETRPKAVNPDPVKARAMALRLLKRVDALDRKYRLLAPGDRILIAMSDGKDSAALLELMDLKAHDGRLKDLEIHACHVSLPFLDPGIPDHVRERCRKAGIALDLVEVRDQDLERNPDCFRCSFLRRKSLFETAHGLGFNKVAMGHNYDDVVETAMLNLISNGKLETIKPARIFFESRLVLIRPMLYITGKQLRRFAALNGFKPASEPCPFGAESSRRAVGDLIEQARKSFPDIRNSVFSAATRGRTDPWP